MVSRLVGCVSGLSLLAASAAAQAPDPDLLAISAGFFEFDHLYTGQEVTPVARLELRFGGKILGTDGAWRGFGPMAGVMATTRGAAMGYLGVYGEMRLGPVTLQPSLAVGAYDNGGDKELGGGLQFSSGILVAYRFPDASLLGVMLTHISNADIHYPNPGANSALITYALPLGRLF